MSEQVKDGGLAFPSHGSMGEVTHEGMTLRDYFASKEIISEGEMTQALAKALMGSEIPKSDGSNIQIIALYRWWAEAESHYKFFRADSMLAAREAKS